MQKGQRLDRIYGLRHLAEDPWAAKKTSPINWFDDYSASWVHRGNDHTPTWLIPIRIIKFLLYCLYILMSI